MFLYLLNTLKINIKKQKNTIKIGFHSNLPKVVKKKKKAPLAPGEVHTLEKKLKTMRVFFTVKNEFFTHGTRLSLHIFTASAMDFQDFINA